MRKLWLVMLSLALVLCMASALAEPTTVNLPDQNITVRVYGNAAVERRPNTVVRSFISDRTVAWTAAGGVVSGDIAGTTVATLTEYDQDTDTYYVTKVNITVLPRDPDFDREWDKSANSEAFEQYRILNGYNFPVGAEFSYKMSYTYKGEKLAVTYRSSNPEVATIDANGWVKAVGAGTTIIEARCPEMNDGITTHITVYSSNTGGSIWGAYEPEDPATVATVYAQPDTSSKQLFTFDRNTQMDNGYADLHINIIAKKEGWVRITCQLGTGWMTSDGFRFIEGKMYESPKLEEGESVSGMPSDETYRTFSVGSTLYANDAESWIYKEADKASTILVRLKLNDTVTVLAQDGSWLKVSYDGTTGYMLLHGLSATKRETVKRELTFPCTMYVYVLLDDMTAFAGPGTGGGVFSVPANAEVRAVGFSDDGKYIKIEYGGMTGYMNERYLTSIKPANVATPPSTPDSMVGSADEDVVTHLIVRTGNSGSLAMRKGASTNTQVIKYYKNGVLVPVLSFHGEWVKVRLDGREGYMKLAYLAEPPFDVIIPDGGEDAGEGEQPPASAAVMVVKTENGKSLNLRAKAQSGATVLGQYPVGTKVTVLDQLDGTWNYVSVGGKKGYMMDKFLVPDTSSGEGEQPETPEQPSQPSGGTVMVVKTGDGNKLNLRDKTKNGSVIGQYPVGTKVTVLDQLDGTWNYVKVGGKTGYMMDKFLVPDTSSGEGEQPGEGSQPGENEQPETPTQPSQPSGGTVMVVKTGDGKKLNLRDKTKNGSVIGQYPVGTKVTVLDQLDGTWNYVSVGSKTGYMMDKFLVPDTSSGEGEQPETPTQPSQPSGGTVMVVKTGDGKKLNLRDKTKNGSVIGQYPVGTKVTVLDQLDGTWNYVSVGGKTGYMMDKFLVPEGSSGATDTPPSSGSSGSGDVPTTSSTVLVVRTDDGKKLNLRDKPKSGAVILGQYPVGTQVTVLNPLDGTWNYVSVGGQTGYMMDKFLKAE